MKTTRGILCKEAKERPRGFSLITTVTMLVLLSLIAIGLLSLSAVTVRSGSAELAQLEAKANARLALMLALGELQKYVGPDQRISAAAGILDPTPETLEVEPDGVTHPYWTAVWSTKWAGPNGDENVTPWVRNDKEGGLSDRRFDRAGFDRVKEVLSYLVSGNEGGKEVREPANEFLEALKGEGGKEVAPDEEILMVGPGTVGSEAGGSGTEKEVIAKRVPLTQGDRERGGYAFWVGDNGIKANIGQPDRYRDDDPQRGPNPDGMERLVNAQDSADEHVDGLGRVDDKDAEKLITNQSVALSAGVNVNGLKDRYHDITALSRSVLTNVRQGGLQRDLTVYLNSRDGEIPNLEVKRRRVAWGLSDTDNIVGPANPDVAEEQSTTWEDTKYRDIAPTFALLRKWHRIGSSHGYDEDDIEAIPPAPTTESSDLRGMNDGVNVYDGSNLRPAGFLPHDEPNISPALVEGSIYYNLATYPDRPGSTTAKYVLRVCLYPRVALWNCYNVKLDVPPTMAKLFVNGNKDVQLILDNQSSPRVPIAFGRGSTNGVGAARTSGTGADKSPGHHVGFVLFSLPAVSMEPGETLVFSPQRASEYSIANPGRNKLSAERAPDPTRYFYQDMLQRHDGKPIRFTESPGGGRASGGDNYLMALKDATGLENATDAQFDTMPLMVYTNGSLQAGGSDELPVLWNARAPVRILELDHSRDRLDGNAIPDVRTRDGFRMRWWEEPVSNQEGSGQLADDPRHLQSAIIANWNPRAAYYCRNPWDNVTDIPPHFYGAYTRDLFDGDVSWGAMAPRPLNGKMLGNPFGPPIDGPDSLVLFEVPTTEIGIPSIGYLRHLKLSEFGWHPSYAVGNSLACPRTGRKTTSPVMRSSQERDKNGWNQWLFGWSDGAPTYWAMLTRQILFERPSDHFVVYDLSYEVNFNLWDNYFVSTGTDDEKEEFVDNPEENPLPNGRMGLYATSDDVKRDINDFHRAATQLMLEGGFNIHSISKEAWKAVLGSTADTGYGSGDAVPFPRMLNPPEGEWLDARPEDPEATSGFRSISDYDLDALAEELVREIKERAPFFGLADFVNRRLRDHKHGEMGPVEAAIRAAEINRAFDEAYPLDNREDLPRVTFDNMSDSTRLDQTLKPDSVAWGLPGYLTQGDIMQVIGSTLTPRSDTFTVRAYGESVDGNGDIQARAWCEAVVQRTPEPIEPDLAGLNPRTVGANQIDWGRRFRVVSFRWMSPEEV